MSSLSLEYRKEVVGGRFCRYDVEERLHQVVDKLTADGWELVWTERTAGSHKYRLQFKRTVASTASRFSA